MRYSSLRNYLRVRGEYHADDYGRAAWPELPPRARRILEALKTGFDAVGTTSACAENTVRPWFGYPPGRNYLRVRGEYGISNV